MLSLDEINFLRALAYILSAEMKEAFLQENFEWHFPFSRKAGRKGEKLLFFFFRGKRAQIHRRPTATSPPGKLRLITGRGEGGGDTGRKVDNGAAGANVFPY